jgi:hypothetical protein
MSTDETEIHDLPDRFVTDRTASEGRGPPVAGDSWPAGPLAKHRRFSPSHGS